MQRRPLSGRCCSHIKDRSYEKTQSVWDGVRSVDFTSSRGSLPSNVEIYNRAKGKWIELFPTKHSWNIKGTVNGAEQSLANGRATITPINVAHKMDNGKVKVNVLSNQELHTSTKYTSDKGFGTIYEKKDILLGADGKALQPCPPKYFDKIYAELEPDYFEEVKQKRLVNQAITERSREY